MIGRGDVVVVLDRDEALRLAAALQWVLSRATGAGVPPVLPIKRLADELGEMLEMSHAPYDPAREEAA